TPPGAAPLGSLKGVQVAAQLGTPIAAKLERKGAKPLRVDALESQQIAAAPAWRLASLGLAPTKFELARDEHVMALPPGENEWIRTVDNFLQARRSTVEGRLQQEE